ncbi:hypothetical protein [Glacieibacterium sp.]|uniref:hypothetical protein n=1 Tax=Glacieibacterium sp. TaxID=2860237 RepID=UPI003B00311F
MSPIFRAAATALFFAACFNTSSPTNAATAPAPVKLATTVPTYADLVSLTLGSPVIVRATIIKAERLGNKDAPDVAAGRARLLMTAQINAALIAPDAVPAMISYLVELPLDARGKVPKAKGAAVLLFLRPSERPGQYSLVRAAAQLDADAQVEATLRTIITEARANTAPNVTGVGNAFRVPGSVPGEAESQFFLTTASGRPVSLVVLSRPGQQRTVQLAVGDVIDDSAATIKPATLTWYRLACFLPKSLPARVGGDDLAALADDYALVLSRLGPCERRI